MQEFLTFIGELPIAPMLVFMAALLGTIMLAVAESFAVIFFPGLEVEDGNRV